LLSEAPVSSSLRKTQDFAPGVAVPSFVPQALDRGLAVEPSQRFARLREGLAVLEPKARRLRGWIAATASLTAIALGGGMVLRSLAQADSCAAAGAVIDASWPVDRQAVVHAAFGRSDLPFAETAWQGVRARIDIYTSRWRNLATAACRATHIAHTQSEQQLDKRMLCLDRGRRQLVALVTELGGGTSGMVEHAIDATEALPDLDRCADDR
jgi:hypothetical protein